MNRIYKVIWNKAKHCYVVVSELAKSRTKSPSVGKSIRGSLAAVIAAAVISGGMMFMMPSALAAEPAASETSLNQYVAYKGNNPQAGYTYDSATGYCVRNGYKIIIKENGEKYTPLSNNSTQIDIIYTGDPNQKPTDIIESVQSTISPSGTTTNLGESLNKVTPGTFSGVTNSGGTDVSGDWNYIIHDSSWEGHTGNTGENKDTFRDQWNNTYSTYKDGYADLVTGKTTPKGFVTTGQDSKLQWNEDNQYYTYDGEVVDTSNLYVIDGSIGVFTKYSGELYKGNVYGKNNEILMTAKKDDKYYSYWASPTTQSGATMETYPVEQYHSDLQALVDSDTMLYNNDIKEVKAEKVTNGLSLKLMRNGKNGTPEEVDGTITITGGGGTDNKDTFVKVSSGDVSQTFNTGSKVTAANGTDGKLSSISVNGTSYDVPQGKTYTSGTGIEIEGDQISSTVVDTDTYITSGSLNTTNNHLTLKKDANDPNETGVDIDLSSLKDTYTGTGAVTVNGNQISVATGNGLVQNNSKLEANIGSGLKFEGETDGQKKIAVDTSTVNLSYKANGGTAQNVSLATGLNFVNGDNTTATVEAGGTVKINAKDSYVATATLENNHLKITQNNDRGNFDIDLSGITAGMSKTDYRLVKPADGKYTVGTNGKITLQVKDVNDPSAKAENIEIDGIAVVYDGKGNLISSNADSHVGDKGKNSIVLGKGAGITTTGLNAWFGNADNSTVVGDGAWAYNGSSTALGAKAHSGKYGIAIGYNANPNDSYARQGGITIGANAKSHGLYSTVIGTDTAIEGNSKKIASTAVQGAASTVIGAKNLVDNKEGDLYSGIATSITGAANTVTNSNGVTIQGTGNTVTNAYKDMNISSSEASKIANGDYSILSKKDSGAVAVIGGANTISDTTSSTFIGFGNKVTGNAEKGSSDVFVAGSHNTLTNTSNTVSLGNNITLADRNNVVTFGNNNKITADNAVAVGNDGEVSVKGGVALGDGSIADREARTFGEGLTSAYLGAGKTSSTWVSTTGAVSVGGNGATRQITNVAAGSQDTDAVNVAQLKQAQTALEESSYKGWKLSTEKNTAVPVTSTSTVNFSGTETTVGEGENAKTIKNIVVTNDGTNVMFGLAQDLNVNSVTSNNMYVTNVDTNNKNSVTNVEYVQNEAAKAKTTVSEGKNITVTPTTEADGHINYNVKLNDDIDVNDVKSNSANIGGVQIVDKQINIDNGTIIDSNGFHVSKEEGYTHIGAGTVDLNDRINLNGQNGTIYIENSTENKLTFDENGLTIGSGISNTVIKNSTIQSGGILINGNADAGTITGLSNKTTDYAGFATSGRAATEEQLKIVSDTANKGWNLSTNGENATNVAPGTTVDFSNTDNNIVISKDEQNNVKVDLNKDIKVDSVTADNANIGGVQIAEKQINIDNGTIIDSNGFHVSKEEGYTHIGAGTVDLNDRINLNGQNGTIYVENSTENKLIFDENGLTIGSGISNTVIKNSTIQSGGILINGNADAGTITGLSNKTTDYAGFATSGRAATEEQLKTVKEELTANDKHLVANPDTENGHYNVSDSNSIDLKMSDGSQITIDNVAKADDLGDVSEIDKDLKNKDGSHTSVVDGLNNLNNKVDNLDGRVDDIEKTAGKHSSVSVGNGLTLDATQTNEKGGTDYKVGLANDFTLGDKASGNFIDVNGSGGNITASNQVVVGKGGEGNNQVVIDGNKGTVSGLTNTTWDDNTAKAVADNKNGEKGIAATQGQLSDVDAKVNSNTTQINNNTANIQNNSNRITNLENRVGDVEERINKVGAMAAAMANLHTMGYDPAAPTEISAGIGQYKGETALAVGFFHYPNQDFMVSGSISVAGDEVMAGVGATWKIGRKSQAQLDAREAEKRIEKAAAIKRAAKDAEVRAQAQRHAQLLAEREAHHDKAAADTAAPAADAAANA